MHYIIGIDTGVNTGFAIWNKQEKKFEAIGTMLIHQAMKEVERLHEKNTIFVRVEDSRQRKWFGKAGREQLQGAGSIKRDAKIWEDFLMDIGVNHEMVSPAKNRTKLKADTFKTYTGWENATNEHSRDAAMLVFNYCFQKKI